jgi:hypothetical protein
MDSVYWPLEPSRTSRLYRPDWNLSYNGMKMQANARRLWGELVVYMGNGNLGLSRSSAMTISTYFQPMKSSTKGFDATCEFSLGLCVALMHTF